MILYDALEVEGTRRTADGYLAAFARVARTGVQTYTGKEVGRPDLNSVRVYRSEAEVFTPDSLKSFAFKPVTIEHPDVKVTADNWKKLSVGQTGTEVLRDGQFLRIPFFLMDAAAIKLVEDGKRELSMGYETTLQFDSGTSPEGEEYDAIQTAIRGNHLAVVAAARGGQHLRIGDSRSEEMADVVKTIIVDGLSVTTTEAGEKAILKLQGDIVTLKDSLAKKEAEVATAKATFDADKAKLDAELATAKAAILTGDKLDAAIVARSKLILDAKLVAGSDIKVESLSDADIRKAAVVKKLGDAACVGKEQVFFDHGFELLLTQVPASQREQRQTQDTLRQAIGGQPVVTTDADKTRREFEEKERNAWRGKAA